MKANDYVAIVATGCANLNSLRFMLEKIGLNVKITDYAAEIEAAEKVFLPGVGTSQAAMSVLQVAELDAVIPQLKQPVLGICLGMQLLATSSMEAASQQQLCLDVVEGSVNALPVKSTIKLPHMGWNTLKITQPSSLFTGLDQSSRFYFVHSYALPVNGYTLASCNHGIDFSAVIQKNNFFGVQFHPEKSGKVGEQFLRNFMEYTDDYSVN